MKTLLYVVYFILLFSPGFSFAQNLYKLQGQESLKSLEIQEIQLLLNKAENLLPAKMKGAFSRGIEVQFSLTGKAHGKALKQSKNPRMVLNQQLIPLILAGEANSPEARDPKGHLRIHKTQYKEALATVLHETAHLYDFLNLQTNQMKEKMNWCSQVPVDDQVMREECAVYTQIKTTISSNPYYLEVAGWMLTSNGNGDRSQESFFKFRTPDPYELANPLEHFAVNFEYFLLDPEYACKRPSLANFFSRHFGVPKLPCVMNYNYVDPDATDVDKNTKKIRDLFKEIPLDRIYQIHYLQAEAGSAVMSRFGHSMLRLVICAPGQPKGPACLSDSYDYHLVLSFRAFVGTGQINSWAGLTGGYPSRLFVIPLSEVVHEYNEVEYRGLSSYPLNLNPDEIKNIIERALETHWSYDSRYYFISNNCATETMNLLRSSLLRPELMDKKIVYPNDLLRALLREKIAGTGPKDKTAALQAGYYFESQETSHLVSYKNFFNKESSLNEMREFFKLPVEERRQLYLERLAQVNKPLKMKDVMGPFRFETHLLNIKQSHFFGSLVEKIWDSKTKNQEIEDKSKWDLNTIREKALKAFNALSAPYQILNFSEYGIPTDQQIKDSSSELAEVRSQIETAREKERELREEVKKSVEYQELEKIRQLRKDLLSLI